jgi:hypothetical protein
MTLKFYRPLAAFHTVATSLSIRTFAQVLGFLLLWSFTNGQIACRRPSSSGSKAPVPGAGPIYLGNFHERDVLPVEESCDRFGSWEEASQTGKNALKKLSELYRETA